MTNKEFNKLVKAAKLKPSASLEAARLVLVKNYNRSQAGRELGIAQPTVTAMLHKIPNGICKDCGAAIMEVKKKTRKYGPNWCGRGVKQTISVFV